MPPLRAAQWRVSTLWVRASGGIARFSARGAPGGRDGTPAHARRAAYTHRAGGALACPLERVRTHLRDGSVRPLSQERAAECVRLHVRSVTTRPILWDMVGPGQVTCSSQAVRARGAAGEQSAHGAESSGVHCLVAAPDGRRSRDNQCMPPPPGEDAVLHREERAVGADLAAPSSMVDPSDDVGEGGTTTAKQCYGVPGCWLTRA